MKIKFHFTNNARWFVRNEHPGAQGSERKVLCDSVRDNPGILTHELLEKWPFESSMHSRLKELYDAGYLKMERPCDLFSSWKDPSV